MLPRFHGDFIFAEHPGRSAPDARILWAGALDPGILTVTACPADPHDPDTLLLDRIMPWLTCVAGPDGQEHALLSDGWHHIRLDVVDGQLAGQSAVHLSYRLHGLSTAGRHLLTLRRLLAVCQHRRFGPSLFPPDPRMGRWVRMLQVHDALSTGASQREVAAVLFGDARVRQDWSDASDSLRARVRRLVREARAMAAGGYRHLLWRR